MQYVTHLPGAVMESHLRHEEGGLELLLIPLLQYEIPHIVVPCKHTTNITWRCLPWEPVLCSEKLVTLKFFHSVAATLAWTILTPAAMSVPLAMPTWATSQNSSSRSVIILGNCILLALSSASAEMAVCITKRQPSNNVLSLGHRRYIREEIFREPKTLIQEPKL